MLKVMVYFSLSSILLIPAISIIAGFFSYFGYRFAKFLIGIDK